MTKNSKEALKKRADASFKKDERAREGTKAMLAYEAEGRASGDDYLKQAEELRRGQIIQSALRQLYPAENGSSE